MKSLSLDIYEKEVAIQNIRGYGNCYLALVIKEKKICNVSQKFEKWQQVNVHGTLLFLCYQIIVELVLTRFYSMQLHYSLTDAPSEGTTWYWENIDQMLYPGYSNWCTNQPDDAGLTSCGEDCMTINYGTNRCWNHFNCDKMEAGAVCEAIP